jgi:hypothetical protein
MMIRSFGLSSTFSAMCLFSNAALQRIQMRAGVGRAKCALEALWPILPQSFPIGVNAS